MSVFILKLIACISMIFDHIKYAYGDMNGWGILSHQLTVILSCIGRMAFPIFAFLLVNSWEYTKNKNKYFLRMLLFSSISQVPYTLALYPTNLVISGSEIKVNYISIDYSLIIFAFIATLVYCFLVLNKKFSKNMIIILVSIITSSILIKLNQIWIIGDELNVFYTLSLGITSMYFIDVIKNKSFNSLYKYLLLFLVILIGMLLIGSRADYGDYLLGIVLIANLYLFKKYKFIQSSIVIFWGYLTYVISYNNLINFYAVIMSAILILFYNHKQGFTFKYPFYIIYPVHLFLIGIINIIYKLK